MKFSLLELEDEESIPKTTRKTNFKKRKTSKTKSIKNVSKEIIPSVSICKTAPETDNTSTSTHVSNFPCSFKSLSSNSNSVEISSSGTVSNLNTKAFDVKFKSFFDTAPNSSKVFSGISKNVDAKMDWEISLNSSLGHPTRGVDFSFSKPSTSSNMDDSIVICETKIFNVEASSSKSSTSSNLDDSVIICETGVDVSTSEPSTNFDDSVIICETKKRSDQTYSEDTCKYSSDSVVDVKEVLIISDAEDECPPCKAEGTKIENTECHKSLNAIFKIPTKSKDIICVSSPDLYPIGPPLPRFPKGRKKRAVNAIPNISAERLLQSPRHSFTKPVTVSNASKKMCQSSQPQSELKIVSEVKNTLPLSQRFGFLGCKAKSNSNCRQKNCFVHQNSAKGSTIRFSLPRHRAGYIRKCKPMLNGNRIIPQTSLGTGGSLITGPDVLITSEKLVTGASKNFIHDMLPSCSVSSSVDSSRMILQNKANTIYFTSNLSTSKEGQSYRGMLRPIVVDGSNVAYTHGQKNKPKTYSCRGIEICVKYFQDRGHKVTVFVPQYRRCKSLEVVGQEILERLGDQQVVVFTPSRKVDGVLISSYDDRFILDLAARTGGVIVSNDNYRDLKDEKPEWRESVNERLLMYLFVGDHFMVPDDPLGSRGMCLNKFLSFPS